MKAYHVHHLENKNKEASSLTGKSGTHPCSPVWKWSPFLWQNTDFSAQNDPFFAIKLKTFQSKMNPLFCSKTFDFSAQMNPLFHSKTLYLRTDPFYSKFMEVSTKITPFSRKMWILDFLKKYPFIHEF